MRILRIEIAAFGKWRQKSFDFTSGNQLIYGENEAGKSTIYQFIQAILFGFPSKGKKKKDYTPKDGSAYGGKLWLEHPVYGEIMVERYKQQNRGKAKVRFNEQVGSDELLEKLITPLTKELFQQVFTFQQEQLTELEYLREKELHDALISLGITGSSQVFQKRQDYFQEAQQLFKKKGQKLLINQKLNEWKLLQEKVQQKQNQEAYFSQLVQQEQNYSQEQTVLQEKLQKINEKISQIKQQELNYPLYEEWQTLKSKSLSEVPEEKLLIDLEDFSKRYQQMTERLDELETTLEKHSGMDQQSARYYFYLENEETLKEILKQQNQVEQSLKEWERLQIEERETESELKILEQRWHWLRQQAPKEFLYTEEWQQLLTEYRSLSEKRNQLSIRSEIIEEQQLALETEINKIEEEHPELINSQPVSSQPKMNLQLIVISAIFIVIAFFIPMPWKLVPILFVVGNVAYYLYKQRATGQKSNLAEVKGMWQEKLGQLDSVLAQIEELNQKNKKCFTEQQVFEKKIGEFSSRNHLAQMNTFEAMRTYGQEVSDYQRLLELFEQKQVRVKEIKQKLMLVESKLEIVKEWLPIHDRQLTEKMGLLAQFVEAMEQLKFARSYQQNTLLKQEINQLKKKQKTLLAEYNGQLQKAGLMYPSEVPVYLQKAKQTKTHLKRLTELTEMLTSLFPKSKTREQLSQELRTYQQEQYRYQLEEKEIIEKRQRLKIQVEELQRDGTLDELYQEASLVKSQLEQLFEEWGGLAIAATFLGDLSTEMSERQLPQLLKIAGDYLGVLTKDHYHEILLQNDTLTLTDGSTEYPIYELSTGTKDQLIMAMRFAYLSLEAKRSICPIIIDDGWLHYDHQRKYQLAKLLAEFGEKYQVICFSSDQEMVSYYQELKQAVNILEGANNEKNS
ncbi:AAA family ATPase [Enterococcus durans]|uniref:ATP-binding protein n=1 Tax=Enterococcus durans TaxID=53345 RepID=UPI0018818403|nr:AAA family ATPase [Enterococcus durans]MBE8846590.1 AAA family ATPase [Enterococcus durans]MDB1653686.1 AAA family ATPase [Enterococcus durans]MDB1656681.1 AAA family ATPase [Enterococcus durans]MDB1664445.1 AAA family ATPase [Enterococcus durans]MDB1669710.1 AAA family ATPase [Enterococcus durans]